jgi:mono/diheme cytochrome c family protein
MCNLDERDPQPLDRRYRPPLPETPSVFSRWALRCELVLTTVLAIAFLIFVDRPPIDDADAFTGPTPRLPLPQIVIEGPDSLQDSAQFDDASDAAKGQALFAQSCTSCHGQTAQGLPRMGVNLRESKFIAATSNLRLIAFLKSGRQPTDPKNLTGVPMPPRGGNLALDDEALADIVAFLRQVQKQ